MHDGKELRDEGFGMKILLVDDHALFRAGLRMLLTTYHRDAVMLEASTIMEAMELCAANGDLQLCLLDLTLKTEDGLRALAKVAESAPLAAIVVVSATEDPATICACLDAGAMSFIPKSAPPAVLAEALRQVLSGAVYLPAQVLTGTVNLPERPILTARQNQVLRAVSRGLSNKVIARELGLSESTVKEYLGVVFQALGVRNRTEAVIRAMQFRLLDGPGSV
jgi:DNA-binding NarL/FixJ family response regulator